MIKGGDLVLDETLTPEQLDDSQPHQVSKKTKLLARYDGLLEAGSIAIDTTGLRLDSLGKRLSDEKRTIEQKNTSDRANQGRFLETHYNDKQILKNNPGVYYRYRDCYFELLVKCSNSS